MITDLFDKNPPPGKKLANSLIEKIDFPIDNDYLQFIIGHNDAEAFLSTQNFLMLWDIETIISLNPRDENDPDCFNWFFFGSDGSNLGYAFDKLTGNILAMEFIGMEPEYVASSFKELLEKLAR